MSRTLDQILAEVTAKSDPQRQIVLGQISSLPTQQAADEAGLEAKKTQAFDDILGGARRRGLGFSGIPLGEQAKYTATDYAPALANMKAGYNTRKSTLESALADIGRSDYMSAQDIFDRDRTFAENQRRYELEQAASAREAATQASPYAGLFGAQGSQQQAPAPDPMKQKAQKDVANLLLKDKSRIQRELDAIAKSAGFGNTYDQLKLQLLQASGYKPTQKASNKPLPGLGSINPYSGGSAGGNANNTLLRALGL